LKLKEAIELLTRDLHDPGCADVKVLNKAKALSIEAMKRIQTWRQNREGNPDMLIPGETKED